MISILCSSFYQDMEPILHKAWPYGLLWPMEGNGSDIISAQSLRLCVV